MSQGEFKKRYSKLESDRKPYENRARRVAEVTIPSLFPMEGTTGATQFLTPYQSVAARGINNLASKLLLVSLPTSHPFFRYIVSERMQREMEMGEDERTALQRALGKMERLVMQSFEQDGVRVQLYQTFRQLLVAGNVLFYKNPITGKAKNYRLDKYVCTRDPEGRPLEIIVKEEIDRRALPVDIQRQAGIAPNRVKPVEVFTRVVIQQNAMSYVGFQEVNGVLIPSTETEWDKDLMPYIPLRFTAVDGEDYGRSFCEEYVGDVLSLEGLSQALVEGAAAAARVVFLVRPNSSTSLDDIVEAENGMAVPGNIEDVAALRVENANDMRVADATAARLEQRLQQAFLLNSAVQRDAERVTATEIREAVAELDDALGGYYTLMSHELQHPLVRLQTARQQRIGELPPLPHGSIKPTIITGIEALGRGHELVKIRGFIQDLSMMGPEVLATWVDVGKLIERLGTGHGIDLDGMVKTAEQVAQEQQQAMMQAAGQQMIDALGPGAMKLMQDQLNPANQQTKPE